MQFRAALQITSGQPLKNGYNFSVTKAGKDITKWHSFLGCCFAIRKNKNRMVRISDIEKTDLDHIFTESVA